MSKFWVAGATGFLGPHLVDQLLRQTQAKVVCIVRAPSDAQARERLLGDFHVLLAKHPRQLQLGDLRLQGAQLRVELPGDDGHGVGGQNLERRVELVDTALGWASPARVG